MLNSKGSSNCKLEEASALYISKQIVESFDGKIFFTSQFGRGTTFIFDFKVQKGRQGNSSALKVTSEQMDTESDDNEYLSRTQHSSVPFSYQSGLVQVNEQVEAIKQWKDKRVMIVEDLEQSQVNLVSLFTGQE